MNIVEKACPCATTALLSKHGPLSEHHTINTVWVHLNLEEHDSSGYRFADKGAHSLLFS